MLAGEFGGRRGQKLGTEPRRNYGCLVGLQDLSREKVMRRQGRLTILFAILALAACAQPQTQFAPYSSANDRDAHGGIDGGGGGGGSGM
jgi:hypothetical protein